ncbi:MAG: prepilin-type N-terminal cleavage/methylation domain-containing protein [Thauera sp.]|jgi:general secretion pathway protein J|nr:prepilin-type N-terminal cleavage/methylation domain-containing protein [Thauera sp.]
MKRRQAGFTLVEVLIAVTLLSLLLLGLMATIGSFGRGGARLEELSKEMDEVRLVSAFLRQTLAAAAATPAHTFEDGAVQPYFIGGEQTLEWLAPLPARHGVGGLHRLRLSVREQPGGMDLLLQYQPYLPPDPLNGEVLPDWSQLEENVLARDLDAFRIAYQGGGEEGWSAQWGPLDVLPLRLTLHFSSAGKAWPPLVVILDQADVSAEMGVIR